MQFLLQLLLHNMHRRGFSPVSAAWLTSSLLRVSDIMTDRKAVIKNADMTEDMQQDAVDCATQAMEKYNIEKDIAAYIKKVTMSDGEQTPPRVCLIYRKLGFRSIFVRNHDL